MKEKLLKALNSSDLEDDTRETHVQVIAALGASQTQIEPELTPVRRQELLAGINLPAARTHLSMGALLLHIRAGHHRFYPRALTLLKALVERKAKKERWAGVSPKRASEIATIALERHFNPLCVVCNGVGKIGELGQVIVLCSRANGGCGGTGKKEENWRGWMERVKDVLSLLGSWEGYAVGGAAKQAGRTRYWG